MTTLFTIIAVGIWLYGAYALTRRVGTWSVRRHRQVRSDRVAIDHLSTDRMIRENEHELWPDKQFHHLNCVICGPGPLYQGMVPSKYEHPFYKMGKTWRSDGYTDWQVDVAQPSLPDTAEMVSSLVVKDDKGTGTHTVMLDLDYPVTLVESSTTGHHHLYIDHVLTWSRYAKLLKALADAGLIEQAFYKASMKNHATMLRPPWVQKRHRSFALPPATNDSLGESPQRLLNALTDLVKRKGQNP
jgi:hypothetical protein